MARTSGNGYGLEVFGFDELEKAFERCGKRYPDEADALLMAAGQNAGKRVRSLTPVKTGKLRRSWRVKSVKLYKGGTVRVVRIQSSAPHAHLVELGHEIVSGGRSRERGRKLNRVQRSVRGIKSHGRVEGRYMLEQTMTEANEAFRHNVERMFDKITEDIQE